MKVVAVPFEPVSQIDSALKREFPFGDDDVTPPLKDETTIDHGWTDGRGILLSAVRSDGRGITAP